MNVLPPIQRNGTCLAWIDAEFLEDTVPLNSYTVCHKLGGSDGLRGEKEATLSLNEFLRIYRRP